jgi:hypothetical protein
MGMLLIRALSLICLLCSPTWAAVSYVKAICTGTTGATCSATPSNINDALIIYGICASSSTPAKATTTLTGTGYSFTTLGVVGSTSTSWIAIFGGIAPNTSTTTLTLTFKTSGGTTISCSFESNVGDEFTGNDTTGGTTTFDATGTLGASSSSGSCSFATITPANNNDALDGVCSPASSLTSAGSGFTLSANDGSADGTEFKILSGGSGVAQTVNFTSSGGWASAGMTIKPAAGAATPTGMPTVQ